MNNFFKSTNLKNIHSKAEEAISNHLSKLDQVSNDIKIMETILIKSAFPLNYVFHFESDFKDGNIAYSEINIISTRCESQHCIVWDKEEQRLIYRIYLKHVSGDREWEPEVIFSKPLIETKAHIRLKIMSDLEHFYQGIIDLLGTGHINETITCRSPKGSFIDPYDQCPF